MDMKIWWNRYEDFSWKDVNIKSNYKNFHLNTSIQK